MPRYYFNFRNGPEVMPDPNGMILDNASEAYMEAYGGAQEIWADMIKARKDPTSCAFEVLDEAGMLVVALPFAELLDHCGAKLSTATSPRLVGRVRPQVERARRLRLELSAQFDLLQENLAITRRLLARGI